MKMNVVLKLHCRTHKLLRHRAWETSFFSRSLRALSESKPSLRLFAVTPGKSYESYMALVPNVVMGLATIKCAN